MYRRKNPENCIHENKKDFSFFDHMAIKQSHFYCPDCKSHWFKDREWTAEEWDDYSDHVSLGIELGVLW